MKAQQRFTVTQNQSNLGDALATIVNSKIFLKKSNLNLFSHESFETRDFKAFFLLKLVRSQTVVLEESPSSKRRNSLSIFVIKSCDEFTRRFGNFDSSKLSLSGLYVLVAMNKTTNECNEIFEILWQRQMYNVILLSEDGDVISVTTFVPFSDDSCNDTKSILINQFKDGEFVNSTETLFPAKMRNLHNCPIRVSISNSSEPFIFTKPSVNGSIYLSGRDIHLINTLAKKLNFTTKYTFIGKAGFFYENGTAEGPLKALLEAGADFSLSDLWLKASRLNYFDASSFYITDKIVFTVPPGRELTSFELLILPFKSTVWALWCIYFVVGFLVIIVIQSRSKAVQNYVFGSEVKTPLINLFIGFVGGVQSVLPKANFPRFLLMVFLLYSLVIRTVYQGAYYRILRSDRHHKEVETIEQMIREDYRFYAVPGHADIFGGSPEVKKR